MKFCVNSKTTKDYPPPTTEAAFMEEGEEGGGPWR